ncbi:hypothetical protein FGO68_gene16991 [Halteria grandinella]|uniref:Uncharacterized protein n=1 Tax=Halteria grandinella TaxID=5974 RepID=A0A8J8SXN8_HALGN|nr:hypothetical protein FGO68_gene16991 [Halteria grandinella]
MPYSIKQSCWNFFTRKLKILFSNTLITVPISIAILCLQIVGYDESVNCNMSCCNSEITIDNPILFSNVLIVQTHSLRTGNDQIFKILAHK